MRTAPDGLYGLWFYLQTGFSEVDTYENQAIES
jgi:hypothetical protein